MISLSMLDAILESCPDSGWRAIFALFRYAGLRCQSRVRRADVSQRSFKTCGVVVRLRG